MPPDDRTYRFVPGLWVVTAYFNPAGYASRRRNHETFARLLRRSGLPLLTVECAFEGQRFDLPPGPDVVQLRGRTPLWQKERLLNLAVSWLPPSCRAVAWIDADVVFENLDWAADAVAALEQAPVVQLFETCDRLGKDGARGDVCTSFAARLRADPRALATGRFEDHGHTGYAWAARRELLDRHGLYEHAIAGSADHFMAHAIFGDLRSPCIERMMLGDAALTGHFRAWGEPFAADVAGRLGVVAGEVLHLWHGELEDRRYFLRHVELARHGFNPYRDVVRRPGRPLELREDAGLNAFFAGYFTSRREDGAAP